MKYAFVILVPLAVITWSLSGCKSSPHCCLIAPPALNLTSEKTGVERQIIGDYMELEKDAWTVSSVKSSYGTGKTQSGVTGDEELQKAESLRAFHAEKLAAYKTEGAAGEGNDGYVSYIKNDKYEADPAQKKILLAVLDEENGARKLIFTRSLFAISGKNPSKDEVAAFGRMFADEQRVQAAQGEWVQENSGKWVKKK